MSLLSSINLANNTLRAAQIGLQVVGQNIANVNTPGYIREEVIYSPAPTQRRGNLLMGLGVEVRGVVQRIDRFLEERLRSASGDRASAQTQQEVWRQLEGLVGELTDTDLSTSLNSFFSAIHEVLNQPESVSVRNLAVLQGRNLAAGIAQLGGRVEELRQAQNDQAASAAADINRLVEEIRKLNVQIAAFEAGDAVASDAVGLRDQRGRALADLAEIVGIHVEEQIDGLVNVFVGGDFLVFGGTARQVEVTTTSENGRVAAHVQVAETDIPLDAAGGRLTGLVVSRDEVLGGFLDRLDDFARTLAFEFNKLFTSGQGLHGYQDMTSEAKVADATAALDAAGLPHTPVNGSFQVQVFDRESGQTSTTDLFVRLAGLEDDTSLADLAAALDAVDGIAASVTPTRGLALGSESSSVEFAFANDTSGVLAALGLATFFTGASAQGLGVNQALIDDPGKFAASRSGIGAGTENAVELAGFLDLPLESGDGQTLAVLYDRLVGETTEASAAASSVAAGFQVFEETLKAQHLAITGVSLDEEAVRLIAFQRSFQAAARYIATLSDLLEALMEL